MIYFRISKITTINLWVKRLFSNILKTKKNLQFNNFILYLCKTKKIITKSNHSNIVKNNLG